MVKETQPKAELLDYSKDAELNVATSARLTHSDKSPQDLKQEMSEERKEKLVKHMIDLGHDSTLENSFYYFHIRCSRVTSHQIVRHRVGVSVAQRSQRYVDEGEFEYIVPPSIKNNEDLYNYYKNRMEKSMLEYKALRDNGIPKEDARFVLPTVVTHMTLGFNARSLRHFVKLRKDKHAQWEIRDLATQMLEQVKEVTPNLFYDF